MRGDRLVSMSLPKSSPGTRPFQNPLRGDPLWEYRVQVLRWVPLVGAAAGQLPLPQGCKPEAVLCQGSGPSYFIFLLFIFANHISRLCKQRLTKLELKASVNLNLPPRARRILPNPYPSSIQASCYGATPDPYRRQGEGRVKPDLSPDAIWINGVHVAWHDERFPSGEDDEAIAEMGIRPWHGVMLIVAWLTVLIIVLVLARTLDYDHRADATPLDWFEVFYRTRSHSTGLRSYHSVGGSCTASALVRLPIPACQLNKGNGTCVRDQPT
eukprot:266908-Chlamydomonas_euryale.AAC.1